MEQTESRFFVKQSMSKGLIGTFLLFGMTLLIALFVGGAFFYPRYGFLQQLRKENQEVLFFIVIMTKKGKIVFMVSSQPWKKRSLPSVLLPKSFRH